MTRAAAVVLAGVAALSGCGAGEAADARLYVASGFTDEVLQLDPGSGALVGNLATDPRRGETDEPHGLAVSPDARHLFVTVSHGEPTLWKFELAGNRLVGRVPLGIAGAGRIGITPDGARAFVPDYYRAGRGAVSEVAVVRLEDLEVEARLELCAAPHDAQVSPSGELVAITCSLSDEIVLLDAKTLEEHRRFFVGADPGEPGSPGYRPLNLVWSPCGAAIYVTLHEAALVRAFDTGGELLGEAAVGEGPAQLAITQDGLTLAVANRLGGSVSLLDAPLVEEQRRIPLGVGHPHGVAVSDSQGLAFITYEGDPQNPGGVVALDLAEGEVRWRATAGAYTLGVVFTEVGRAELRQDQ